MSYGFTKPPTFTASAASSRDLRKSKISRADLTASTSRGRGQVVADVITAGQNLDSSEQDVIDNRAGTVTETDVTTCTGIVNTFVEQLEATGDAGMDETSYAWFEEFTRLAGAGGSQKPQLIALYRLTKAQYQPVPGDCALTLLAYLKQAEQEAAEAEEERIQTLQEEFPGSTDPLAERNAALNECQARGMLLGPDNTCILSPPEDWSKRPAPSIFGKYMTEKVFYTGLAVLVIGGVAYRVFGPGE